MNKKELTAKIATETGITRQSAQRLIDFTFKELASNLEQGKAITIRGFGSFSVINRAERGGTNPTTGQPIRIPARKGIKFTASKNICIK